MGTGEQLTDCGRFEYSAPPARKRIVRGFSYAQVAELVDAPASGAGLRK